MQLSRQQPFQLELYSMNLECTQEYVEPSFHVEPIILVDLLQQHDPPCFSRFAIPAHVMFVAYISHDLFWAGYQDLPADRVTPYLGLRDNVMPLEIPTAFDLEALKGAAIGIELDVQNNLQTLVGSSTYPTRRLVIGSTQ